MSVKHPIIAITGSSGAGTTTVMTTFQQIFRREGVKAATIEGDSFHRYDRTEMRARMEEEAKAGNQHFSHFGPQTNLFEDLEALFRGYGATGTGRIRKYLHDDKEAAPYGLKPGTFTPWEDIPHGTDLLFYEGLHGGVKTETVDVARDERVGGVHRRHALEVHVRLAELRADVVHIVGHAAQDGIDDRLVRMSARRLVAMQLLDPLEIDDRHHADGQIGVLRHIDLGSHDRAVQSFIEQQIGIGNDVFPVREGAGLLLVGCGFSLVVQVMAHAAAASLAISAE